ncbi:MAG: HlyD family efflux transporter periplasmic adaptor subunit [Clostridia bacterium]|nr:HlyD family efflux transporter periplasmic adaptor subunit [Clostridia bacterium]
MKRKGCAALAALLLACTAVAQAQTTFEGRVAAGETRTVTAPFGGTLAQISLREGQLIKLGEEVAQVETTKVYAPMDGTIRGIALELGDSAEKTVCYLSPVNKYTIKATVNNAYDTAENKFVMVGETVYIACTADGSHLAEGVITAVEGSSYTVETTKGELYMEEKVYIYREESRKKATRIGSGSVGRTQEVAIKGSGSLVRLCVEEGETVERGQLLFETVEGALDGLVAQGNVITSPVSGTVASVSVQAGQRIAKGDTVLTLYPEGTYVIEFDVPESALNQVQEGKAVAIYFEQQDAPAQFSGRVLSVDYVAQEGSQEAVYTALASIEVDDTIRLGMSATVMLTE